VVIKLDGAIQTTDRAALKEIGRQLHLRLLLEDEEELNSGELGNYAGTMETLVSILEPPIILDSSTSSDPNSQRPIIFILKNFNSFSSHPRQTFLYCLLDCIQSVKRRSGICVIGISDQVEVMNNLEKRVRSRIGGRVIQVFGIEGGEGGWRDVVRGMLTVDEVNEGLLEELWKGEVERWIRRKEVESVGKYWEALGGGVRARWRKALVSPLLDPLDKDSI
jgi:origin recognition complex subunit 4